MAHHIDDGKTFNAVCENNRDKLIVVDFGATWCGPCRQIAPHFESLANKFPGCCFIKVDADEGDEIVKGFGVRSLPTFVFIKNGKEVHRFSGANKILLSEAINEFS